jgi:hypothetical protein
MKTKNNMNDLVMEEMEMEEENEVYIEKCPRCNSEGKLESEVYDPDACCQNMSCKNCGLEWKNFFTLRTVFDYSITRWMK